MKILFFSGSSLLLLAKTCEACSRQRGRALRSHWWTCRQAHFGCRRFIVKHLKSHWHWISIEHKNFSISPTPIWPPFMKKWVLSEEHRKTVQLYWQSECGQSFYMTARFGTVTTRLYNIGTYSDICIYSGLWHPDSGMRNRRHCRLSMCALVDFVIYWIRSKSKQKSDDETNRLVKWEENSV